MDQIDGTLRRRGLRTRRAAVARGLRFLLCMIGLVLVARGETLAAQQELTVKEEPVPTLHVYADLIQIPVLVLDPQRRPLKKRIAGDRFSLSIDSGPWFRARHVRQEGDDPISLAILLDASGDEENLMPKIADAIAGLALEGLHAKDHVSIYALDCSLVQSLNDKPAESGRLKVAIDEALTSWTSRKHEVQPSNCKESIHLWDALANIVGGLKELPGRRVILAVSNGRDQGSNHSWNELRYLAEAAAVSIFGVTYVPFEAKDQQHRFLSWSSEDPFVSVCELSGGMVLLYTPKSLVFTLERFVTLVRERYIVEFPRPANSTWGIHSQEMKIAKSRDFIRPAGVSYPIPDPSVLADPTTVPSDPSRTPVVGTRKPMSIPQ